MTRPCAATAVLLLSLLAALPPGAGAADGIETLPDGNQRDPAPATEAISALVAQVRKNLVFLPGGTFEMGDWGAKVHPQGLPFDSDLDSKPPHKVKLDAFSIARYPVTFAEFDLFTAALRLPRINQHGTAQRFRKPDNPAGVSWQGAKDYCQWLGEAARLPMDLPSEAQWEYAARSGGKRQLFATDSGKLDEGRNAPTMAQARAAGGLPPVTAFPPNPAGLHLMGLYIAEWTGDWYDAQYYQRSPAANPRGPDAGSERVVRGNYGGSVMTVKRASKAPAELAGGWMRSAGQDGQPASEVPYTRYSAHAGTGFRCVVNSPTKPSA